MLGLSRDHGAYLSPILATPNVDTLQQQLQHFVSAVEFS
jgi:hypothetical protein